MREDIPILLEISMDRGIAEAYSVGVPLVEKMLKWKERFRDLYGSILRILEDVMGANPS